ncbi:MAG: hypothetical protein ACOX6S_14305 [Clostridia bacterium]
MTNRGRRCSGFAAASFRRNKVDLILGFASGEPEDRAVPFFLREEKEVDRLRWDPACTPNLAKYLLEGKGKKAIIAKPCDARAVVMYQVEGQLNREDVIIIGMECEGMRSKDGSLAPGCRECTRHVPPVYDILIKRKGGRKPSFPEGTPKKENGQGTLQDPLAAFQREMEKCILCFSCRQACYGCYCKTCFMDRDMPNWHPADLDLGAKMTFHLGRAMHLAGRCVECGACERVCPSGVKIRYLIQELTDLCKEEYGYEAGMNPDEIPAMAAFDTKDREIGFLGGEEDGSGCDV